METGKALKGGVHLSFDGVNAVTNIVEEMYRNIAATPLPLGRAPSGPAPGIAGLVHGSVRQVTKIAQGCASWVLDRTAPELDRVWPPGPHREAVVAALNGVCGDHLADTDNPLAIDMRLRVLLPAAATPGPIDRVDAPTANAARSSAGAFSNLFDTEREPVEVFPQPDAFERATFKPGRHLLIVLHGLSMNDREWTSKQHNHAEALAAKHGYTPVYTLYNSGRHVSVNGRMLCEQLSALLAAWPEPVESITFLGFSMGGLLARSTLQLAQETEQPWLAKVTRAVYVGTPHQGAVLERGGYWLQRLISLSPYTAPLAALGRVRSAGITDLRHGNVRDDDWQHHDEHEDNADYRVPTPLPGGIEHFAIAATLSQGPGKVAGRLMGDGLVHPSSATGRHKDEALALDFAESNTRIFYNLGHLAMLHDERVMNQLDGWLGDK
ncbi:MAG: hypothetical protein Hals2KO_35750 [Halioglobus sp.]